MTTLREFVDAVRVWQRAQAEARLRRPAGTEQTYRPGSWVMPLRQHDHLCTCGHERIAHARYKSAASTKIGRRGLCHVCTRTEPCRLFFPAWAEAFGIVPARPGRRWRAQVPR